MKRAGYHEDHSGKCEGGSGDLPSGHALRGIREAQDEGSPDGCRTDDQRDVRGRGEFERHVFGQEVERSSADTRGKQQGFVAESVCEEAPAGEGQDAEVGQGKPQQEYLGRGESVRDEDLRGDEGGTPDNDGKECGQVIAVCGWFLHAGQKYVFFRKVPIRVIFGLREWCRRVIILASGPFSVVERALFNTFFSIFACYCA